MIAPHPPRGRPGKPRVDDRRVVGGIPHVLKTGGRWRDCPAECGPATALYNRCNRWSRRGLRRRLFEQVAASGPVPRELRIDGSHAKALRSAAGAKGGSGCGRSGDRVVGAPRRSVARPMVAVDIGPAVPPLGAVALPGRPIADKADDADGLRRWPNARRVKSVIPSTASPTMRRPLDRAADRRRTLIGCPFRHLKNRRRIATRYDRLARNDLAALALVAVAAEWT